MFRPRRIHRSAVACGIALALALPGTALAQQDLRSPDARDAAMAHRQSTAAPQIFTDEQQALVERYKRSPTYLAALRAARVVKAPQVAQVPADDGLDWGDAGIGAAGMLGVIAIALGGVVAVAHRRHRFALTRAQ